MTELFKVRSVSSGKIYTLLAQASKIDISTLEGTAFEPGLGRLEIQEHPEWGVTPIDNGQFKIIDTDEVVERF